MVGIANKKKKKGTSLIEVTAALLISAMTTVAIFSVILSTSVSNKKADKKELAAVAVKMAQERLKAYVTADNSSQTNTFLGSKPGDGSNWHLPGDTNSGWALVSGNHNISSWLNSPCNNTNPFRDLCIDANGNCNCSFTYTVTNQDASGNTNCLGVATVNNFNTCKTVVFNLTFPD